MLRKAVSLIPSVCLLLFVVSGCTRNNGDIGDWFGKWQVTEVKVNGLPGMIMSLGISGNFRMT